MVSHAKDRGNGRKGVDGFSGSIRCEPLCWALWCPRTPLRLKEPGRAGRILTGFDMETQTQSSRSTFSEVTGNVSVRECCPVIKSVALVSEGPGYLFYFQL